MESRLRLKDEETERLNIEREKMKSDRFLQSMSRIVDRYAVVNLDTGRYRYHELRFDQPIYPTSGQYSVWGDRIFEKCGIRRDEEGDGGKTLEIRGKRRLSARDGGANYQQS